MELSKEDKMIGKIAGILGFIQSLAWGIMCFICIGIYYGGLDYYYIPSSYMDSVNLMIEGRFLDKDFNDDGSPFIINPKGFSAFLWIYAILDIFWMGASAQILQATRKNLKSTLKIFQRWVILSGLISFLDILFSILLLADYSKCLDYFSIGGDTPLAAGMFCANSTLPVLVIVGRGYILLVINIILEYFVFKITKTMKKQAAGIDPNMNLGQIPRPNYQPPSQQPTNYPGQYPQYPPQQMGGNNAYPQVPPSNPPYWPGQGQGNDGRVPPHSPMNPPSQEPYQNRF